MDPMNGLIALVVLLVAGFAIPKVIAARKRRKAEVAARQAEWAKGGPAVENPVEGDSADRSEK